MEEAGSDLSRALLLLTEREAAVRRLRGCGPEASSTLRLEASEAGSEEEALSEAALDASCARHFALAARAATSPTDVSAVAPTFVKLLEFAGSRYANLALVPLWILAMIGPEARGPERDSLVPAAAGSFFRLVGVFAAPLQLWIAKLALTWPSSFDATVRGYQPSDDGNNNNNNNNNAYLRIDDDDDGGVPEPPVDVDGGREGGASPSFELLVGPLPGGGDEAAVFSENINNNTNNMTSRRRSRVAERACSFLRVAAPCVVALFVLAVLAALATYILAAARAVDRCDTLMEATSKGDRSSSSDGGNVVVVGATDVRRHHLSSARFAAASWSCAWRSATDLAARLSLAMAAPLLVIPPILFAAHIPVLRAALVPRRNNNNAAPRGASSSSSSSSSSRGGPPPSSEGPPPWGDDDDDNDGGDGRGLLLEDANALWRLPVLVWLGTGATVLGTALGLLVASRGRAGLFVAIVAFVSSLPPFAAALAINAAAFSDRTTRDGKAAQPAFVSTVLRPHVFSDLGHAVAIPVAVLALAALAAFLLRVD